MSTGQLVNYDLQAESSRWLFKSSLAGGGGHIVAGPLQAAQLVKHAKINGQGANPKILVCCNKMHSKSTGISERTSRGQSGNPGYLEKRTLKCRILCGFSVLTLLIGQQDGTSIQKILLICGASGLIHEEKHRLCILGHHGAIEIGFIIIIFFFYPRYLFPREV